VLEPDVRGQLQLLQCEVAFRRALAGRPVDDLVAEGLGLDPRCQPLRAAALVAAQGEGRWEREEELAGVLLSPARSGTRDGIVSFTTCTGRLWPRGPWPRAARNGATRPAR
jgi:hypothetical protein